MSALSEIFKSYDIRGKVATELKLPLIDLHAMSTQLYEALGKEPSGALFKPGDGTHHCNYGAYELSRCVVNGLTAVPALASHLRPGLPAYNPRHPHPLAQFKLPPSAPAAQEALTPLGQ